MIYDCLICGGGTAGLTAAIYLQRAGFSCIVFEKSFVGGQIAFTPEIENFPGLPKGTSGADYSENLRKQAESFGTEIKYEEVLSIDISGEIKKAVTDSCEYEGKNIILAMGATHRKLGLEREDELIGRGVSYCATCDGAFFRNKTVSVVGGGNTAVSDALYLADICEKVYLFHRRDKLRAENYLIEKLENKENVEIVYNANVKRLIGEPLNKIEAEVDGKLKEFDVSALFVAIGLNPQTAIADGILKLSDGYIKADSTETDINGVYAIGDVRKSYAKQLVYAAADGAMAAMKIIEKGF